MPGSRKAAIFFTYTIPDGIHVTVFPLGLNEGGGGG